MKVRLEQPQNLGRKVTDTKEAAITSNEPTPAVKAMLMVVATASQWGRPFFDNTEEDTIKAICRQSSWSPRRIQCLQRALLLLLIVKHNK